MPVIASRENLGRQHWGGTWEDLASKRLVGISVRLGQVGRLCGQQIADGGHIYDEGRGRNDHACLLHLVQGLVAHRAKEILQASQALLTPVSSTREFLKFELSVTCHLGCEVSRGSCRTRVWCINQQITHRQQTHAASAHFHCNWL